MSTWKLWIVVKILQLLLLQAIRENPDSVIEDLRVDGHEVTDVSFWWLY